MSVTVCMPKAMRYVLTVAPAFQICSQNLTHRWDLWYKHNSSFHDWFDVEQQPHHWFAQRDNDEHTSCLALYTGPSYVISDDNTSIMMGEAVIISHDGDQIVDCVHDMYDDEHHKDPDDSLVRQVMLTDPDFWPVVEWNHQGEMWVAAPNLHEFLIRSGTYAYCDKLHTEWDKRASSVQNNNMTVSQPMESSAGNRWFDSRAWDVDAVDELNDPHPSFRPSYHICFSKRYMARLLHQLSLDIYEKRI
jgi:hypothetical protein